MAPAIRAFAVVVLLGPLGCSLGLNTHAPKDAEPTCTTSRARPVLDLIGAGALILLATSLDDSAAPALLGATGLAGVGIYGLARTGSCRRAHTAWNGRPSAVALGGGDDDVTTTTTPAPEAPPANNATGSSDPLVGPPEVAPEAPEAPASTCAGGGACPAGSVCDPLRHQCRERGSAGLEGSRCQSSSSCDEGLYCDRAAGSCRPGRIGRDGGRCRPGRACDDGFTCARGLCVHRAQAQPADGTEPEPTLE